MENQNLAESIERISHSAGAKVGAVAAEVSAQTSGYIKTTKDYVEEKPVQSLVIAVVAGMALGSLLTILLRRKQ